MLQKITLKRGIRAKTSRNISKRESMMVTKGNLKTVLKGLLSQESLAQIRDLNLRSTETYCIAIHEVAEAFNIEL